MRDEGTRGRGQLLTTTKSTANVGFTPDVVLCTCRTRQRSFTKTLGPWPVVRLDTRIIHEWRPFAWLYLYSWGLARFGVQIGHDEPSTA